jgi:hypothetical protein
MACKVCGSERLKTFNREVAVHLPGCEGQDESIVWVFPKVLVCLNCGSAEFAVPEDELSSLGKRGTR